MNKWFLLNLIQVKKIRNFSFALALMNTFFEILAGCISLASTVYCNQIYNLECVYIHVDLQNWTVVTNLIVTIIHIQLLQIL